MTGPTPGPPSLTADDVKDLLLDLYLAQRDLARARAANAALAHRLDVATERVDTDRDDPADPDQGGGG